jgi:glycosyltransferase involved in cell wall biosynthesis
VSSANQVAKAAVRMRIALINPMGDFGISTYTHELAEALVENGAEVDVYVSDRFNAEIADFPRKHRLYPILNSFIFRRRRREANAGGASSKVKRAAPKNTILRPKLPRVRKFLMSIELAWHLRKQKYDLIWTQWPEMESYGTAFWSFARWLGIRTVHTVHNVLPHEESLHARKVCEAVYRQSGRLIVHSQFAAKQLAGEFPGMEAKAIVSRHGLFTVFPRKPEARRAVREQLAIREGDVALLCCGAIRPYKNFGSVIEALCDPRCAKPLLIVAGQEPGNATDPLEHTRQMVEQFGLRARVRCCQNSSASPKWRSCLKPAM